MRDLYASSAAARIASKMPNLGQTTEFHSTLFKCGILRNRKRQGNTSNLWARRKELEEAMKGAHLLAFGKYQQKDGFDQQFPAPNTETETVFGNDF